MKKYIILLIIIVTSGAIYLSFDRSGADKLKNKGVIETMENNPSTSVELGKEIKTESGLKYEIIKLGNGEKPEATDKVEVHYHGTLEDGTVFDSSVDRGETITFGLNQVIKGWTEGLQLMSEGAKYRFVIPHNLAYGAKSSATMPGYTTLIFEVELLEVVTKRRIR